MALLAKASAIASAVVSTASTFSTADNAITTRGDGMTASQEPHADPPLGVSSTVSIVSHLLAVLHQKTLEIDCSQRVLMTRLLIFLSLH